MKGLLIKDFAYLKQNKLLYGFLLIFGLAYSIFLENPYFVLGYYSIFAGVLTLGTFNYDQNNHGLSFLFTLPTTRLMYVKEKYYLGYLLSFILTTVAVLLSMIAQIKTTQSLNFINIEWFGENLVVLLFSILLTALLLPIQFKLGGEKGQYAMFLVFGGIALISVSLYLLGEVFDINIENIIDVIFETNGYALMGVFIVIVGVINFISLKISSSVLEKKEF